MDINLSYAISNEDLVGVLRTILLFLESLNFNETSTVLQSECSSKGYPKVNSIQPKVIIVSPSSSTFIAQHSHQGIQTDFAGEDDGSWVLDSTIQYAPPSHAENEEHILPETSSRILITKFSPKNIIWKKDNFEDTDTDTAQSRLPEDARSMKSYLSEFKRSPNTIETETPSRLVLKCSEKCFRKSYSNPSLAINKPANKVSLHTTPDASSYSLKQKFSDNSKDYDESDCHELKRKFRQLQEDHQKLMSVTAELTTALQTHILGQSENLNSTLNNCRNIYPDLFKSVQQNPSSSRSCIRSNDPTCSKSIIVDSSFNKNAEIISIKVISRSGSAKNDFSDVSRENIHSDSEISISSPKAGFKSEKYLNQEISEKLATAQITCGTSINSKKASDGQRSAEKIVKHRNVEIQDSHISAAQRQRSQSDVAINVNEDNEKWKCLLRQSSSKSCDDSVLGAPFSDKRLSASKDISQALDSFHDSEFHEDADSLEKKSDKISTNEPPNIFITKESENKSIKSDRTPLMLEKPGDITFHKHYFDLDYRKLKLNLIKGDDDLKLRLIQALRWRLTRTDIDIRDQVISSYIRHDLLGLHSSPNSNGQSTLELYLVPNKKTPDPLQEGIARLINTFASLTLGRDYLCQDEDLLITLFIPLIMNTHHSKAKLDAITRDMLIATIQKLSLRNRQRISMISSGLAEHMVTFLSMEQRSISSYCMEYSTALLMNLCLHHEARERLRKSATSVVSLLADLMETKYECCLPYINGAMYSLLGDPVINQEAKRLNLTKLIDYHIKRTTGEMHQQLRFIMKLHIEGAGSDYNCECDSNIEPEYEIDILESELDSQDTLNEEPSGERLLDYYKLLFSPAGCQVNLIHLKCLRRPITPNANSPCSYPTLNANFDEKEKKACEFSCNVEKSTQSEVCEDEASKKHKKEESTTTEINQSPNNIESDKKSLSSSSETSFCEETKQFYHKPSAKKGIFENRKNKKTHKVAPSFTRTIALPNKSDYVPPSCPHPTCPHHFVKTMPIVPKVNSSVANPPYATDFVDSSRTCYRETYRSCPPSINITNCNCSGCECNRTSKYSCNCYNAIKGYIEQTPDESINKNNEAGHSYSNECKKSTVCNYKMVFLDSNNYMFHNRHNVDNILEESSTEDLDKLRKSADVKTLKTTDFSYAKLLAVANLDGGEHICPNPEMECQCYDAVFQSRPKILRTPP